MAFHEEASYAPSIGEFATTFNRRVNIRPVRGQWVRIRPPDREELDQVQSNPWYLPFTRVGFLGTVVEDGGWFIDLSISGTRAIVEAKAFFSTWIKTVEE